MSFSRGGEGYQDSGVSQTSDTCMISEEDIHNGRTSFAMAQGGKLSPCIRETSQKAAIRLIPTETIAKYLSSPKVVGVNELNTTPYVVDLAGERLIAAAGDKLYVRSILASQNTGFTVYRAGDIFQRPETGEVLGYEAKYVADTSLVQAGDPATVVIDKSVTEILIGDRLMPKAEEQFTLSYFHRAP